MQYAPRKTRIRVYRKRMKQKLLYVIITWIFSSNLEILQMTI